MLKRRFLEKKKTCSIMSHPHTSRTRREGKLSAFCNMSTTSPKDPNKARLSRLKFAIWFVKKLYSVRRKTCSKSTNPLTTPTSSQATIRKSHAHLASTKTTRDLRRKSTPSSANFVRLSLAFLERKSTTEVGQDETKRNCVLPGKIKNYPWSILEMRNPKNTTSPWNGLFPLIKSTNNSTNTFKKSERIFLMAPTNTVLTGTQAAS